MNDLSRGRRLTGMYMGMDEAQTGDYKNKWR